MLELPFHSDFEDPFQFRFRIFFESRCYFLLYISMLKVPLHFDVEVPFKLRCWFSLKFVSFSILCISILKVTLRFDFEFLFKWPFLLVRVTLAIIDLLTYWITYITCARWSFFKDFLSIFTWIYKKKWKE